MLGFASAYFLFRKDDKANQLRYITEEREKWREKIRELSVSFMTGVLRNNEFTTFDNPELINIREQVAVRFNPNDEEDNYILCLMDCYIKNNCDLTRDKVRERLSVAFASLLKHDWERVKNEAKMESNSSKIVLFLFSLLVVTFIFTCNNFIPRKLNLFTYKLSYNKDLDFSDLFFWKSLVFVLAVLLFYQLFKYLRWRRKHRFENKLNYCCNKTAITKNKSCWDNYLGYVTRVRVTEFKHCCKKNIKHD